VYVFLCTVFRLIVALFCVMCVVCVLCLIVVPLPPSENRFAIKINIFIYINTLYGQNSDIFNVKKGSIYISYHRTLKD
jgi:hypothetical protein